MSNITTVGQHIVMAMWHGRTLTGRNKIVRQQMK